ncbi:MAG: ornithine cyclodeaminase family protein [Actinobacteria bacterium]|nr:ornithine cyclodeaminase family protein [Actinomycetota bacterium]
MTTFKVLTEADVTSLVTTAEVIDAVERAFVEFAGGRAQMPAKVYLDFPKYSGDLRAMPAALGERYAGVKLVNSHARNPERGLPAVIGTYMLYEQETGMPLCLIGASVLTALRTAAASAVATRHLARPGSSTLGLVGAGAQAAHQLQAVAEVLALREVKVWAPPAGHAQRDEVVEQMRADHPDLKISVVDTAAEAALSDVVCTVTSSREPLLMACDIRPGTHINAVGADGPGKQELDPALLKQARVVVDEMHQAVAGGEINVAVASGDFAESDVAATLGEVITGASPGRTSDEQITIFDSTGLAIQDIAVAILAYERAGEQGTGSAIGL